LRVFGGARWVRYTCRDRDLSWLGLGSRLSYLANLGTKSSKIKTAKGSRAPQGGPDFCGSSRRCREPGPARHARLWCFIFPPSSHSVAEPTGIIPAQVRESTPEGSNVLQTV
jgi:hypothetical protein